MRGGQDVSQYGFDSGVLTGGPAKTCLEGGRPHAPLHRRRSFGAAAGGSGSRRPPERKTQAGGRRGTSNLHLLCFESFIPG